MNLARSIVVVAAALASCVRTQPTETPKPAAAALLEPGFVTLDLDIGDTGKATLADHTAVTVKLLAVRETRDDLNHAIRRAEVVVEINAIAAGATDPAGARAGATLAVGNYQLPTTHAGIQIDCSATRGYADNTAALDKAARLRLWPKDAPWIARGTFAYPARQLWFASNSQMANEPVFVDGGDTPDRKRLYYHAGSDIGGGEGLIDVLAASDGVVVTSGTQFISDLDRSLPIDAAYDTVFLRDRRGWYQRYSHLFEIASEIRLGAHVAMGQKIGVIGKEGGSGGWSHLHFDILSMQPTGKWGITGAYAFLAQAYIDQHRPALLAVARPHQLIWAGQTATLDAARSWAKDRAWDLRFEWTFSDGGTGAGPRVERRYDHAGSFSEVVKVTDAAGNVDYDFATVQVIDRNNPDHPPPTIHATYAPTLGLRAGSPAVFKVRSFRVETGEETWNFGDGTQAVAVRSGSGKRGEHDPNGYAVTAHRFEKPGRYVVRVERTDAMGQIAIAHLDVPVE